MDQLGYLDYVSNEAHMQTYLEYQARYASTIRESDKVLVEFVRERTPRSPGGSRPRLLDIGCSSGNLLAHLRTEQPELELVGGDITARAVAGCRADPRLAGVEFAQLDMLDLDWQLDMVDLEGQLDVLARGGARRRFDVVVANAALMFFDEREFDQAMQSLAGTLERGGWLVAFDYFHPFEQEVTVVETSAAFPEGLKYRFRGYARVREGLRRAGFGEPEFRPFRIPIDLDEPQDTRDVSSYTRRGPGGDGMSFRGTVFQPWCHMAARKETA